MVNCYEVVSKKYNLSGYSQDTITLLMNSRGTEDECIAYFYWLEHVYG
jgi:hypothetical protein